MGRFFPDDYFTNDVDGAAEYERRRFSGELDDYNDWPDPPDGDDEDEELEDGDDGCRCSDPGCPCPGVKRGGSP